MPTLKMTGTPGLKLLHATSLGGVTLELEYSDGLIASIDLAPILSGEICEPLHDPSYFAQVSVDADFDTVTWPNGFDVCPDVLRFWAELGRVCSREETDAHFKPAFDGSQSRTQAA